MTDQARQFVSDSMKFDEECTRIAVGLFRMYLRFARSAFRNRNYRLADQYLSRALFQIWDDFWGTTVTQ